MLPDQNAAKNKSMWRSILIVTLAIVVGLTAWWVVGKIRSQQAERAVFERQVKPKTEYVELAAFGVRYTSSEAAGQISYDVKELNGIKTVPLIASRLAMADYQCMGDNGGDFGYIVEVTPETAAIGMIPAFEARVGSTTYGFVSTIRPECYEAELAEQFSKTVPKTIMESLEPIPATD
jgi:hypothetical protein